MVWPHTGWCGHIQRAVAPRIGSISLLAGVYSALGEGRAQGGWTSSLMTLRCIPHTTTILQAQLEQIGLSKCYCYHAVKGATCNPSGLDNLRGI